MGSERIQELAPLYDEVARCGKCGFCQPTCPVYRTTFREGHVARGKNALFRNLVEGNTVLDADLRDAFDNCLLCRACTASCFSAVETDRLVLAFRETYARRFGRPTLQRLIFRGLLPEPRLMAAVVRAAWAARRLGLDGPAARSGLLDMLNPKLRPALELREGVPGPFLRERLASAEHVAPPATAASGPRVGYWVSCGYNYMLPEVGEAAVAALLGLGASVEVLDNCCCGLPVHGYGDAEGARALARQNIVRLGDLSRFDAVVSECGSCSGHLKEYPALLAADPEFSVRARRLASTVRSFSEYVFAQEEGRSPAVSSPEEAPGPAPVASLGVPPGEPGAAPGEPLIVTFHEPCHLGARYQGVVRQPRELLRRLPGVEFRELPEADSCCGAAGSYNVLHPDVAGAILERKMERVEATGAQVLVTECPACILQLSLGARRAGLAVRVAGIAELVAERGAVHPPLRTG
ncbi:MAG: (Fe-S)-binding protein [Thermoleophilia bacterium]